MSKKTLRGKVVSNKMAKTLVVSVLKLKVHKKYKKRFTRSKKYKAHYEEGEYNIGDKVVIVETKPISKDKKWMVVGFVKDESNKVTLKDNESSLNKLEQDNK